MRGVATAAVAGLVQGIGAGLAVGPAAGVVFGVAGAASAVLVARPGLLDAAGVTVDRRAVRRFLAVAVAGGSIGFAVAGIAAST